MASHQTTAIHACDIELTNALHLIAIMHGNNHRTLSATGIRGTQTGVDNLLKHLIGQLFVGVATYRPTMLHYF
jgi:hypothetical protein